MLMTLENQAVGNLFSVVLLYCVWPGIAFDVAYSRLVRMGLHVDTPKCLVCNIQLKLERLG